MKHFNCVSWSLISGNSEPEPSDCKIELQNYSAFERRRAAVSATATTNLIITGRYVGLLETLKSYPTKRRTRLATLRKS